MRDLEQTETQRIERLDRFRRLFVEEWRRQRITNVDMAKRLGRSLSLTNKLKAGTAPLTAPIIDQFVKVLGIDPLRAMFAVDIARSHLSYFDPKFQSACTTALSFFEKITVEFGYGRELMDTSAEAIKPDQLELCAREAAAMLARSFVRSQPPMHSML